ncbi:MAG: glycoside hydrolase family 2 [Firmicutes bacterium]|nr:glycoside hydrolase family 2 [Bacillota bacterium]
MSNVPRPEYPRPDFVRKDWLNLNGLWEFEFDDDDIGEKNRWYEKEHSFSRVIKVPFCFESEMSGIGDTSRHDHIWYRRKMQVPKSWNGRRIMLRFGAVDYHAKVWINDVYMGSHIGGHTPFSFDITYALKWDGSDEIVVKADDIATDRQQARGKQTWMNEPFGCWYNRTSGIWQTVWLEPVNEVNITGIRLTPDIDKGMVHIEAQLSCQATGYTLKTDISFAGIPISSISTRCFQPCVRFETSAVSYAFERELKLWSPENPNLYDIEFTLFDVNGNEVDHVSSYFGMRKVSVKDGKVLLNNHPYYQKLILDQGYFPKSNLTAPDEEALINDIKMTKAFGYNGVRKHQKVEDPIYLYWCDKLGLLIWGEMASYYEYSPGAANIYMKEWQEIINRDYNHPCIIAWTPFNESWGVPNVFVNKQQQCHTVAVVNMIRSLDATRLVISNDGWEHTDTDLCTIHDYRADGDDFIKAYTDKDKAIKATPSGRFIFAQGYSYQGQPVLITEYGGIAFASDEGWGYGKKVKDEEEFLERFAKITHAIMSIDYICGFCYTQLTDVQQEVNGLMTYDRKPKFNPDKIKAINKGR